MTLIEIQSMNSWTARAGGMPVGQTAGSTAQHFRSVGDFTVPGFTYRPPPYGRLAFRLCSEEAISSLFTSFAGRVLQAIGHTYLPVFRMADGEFAFMVGWESRRGRGLCHALSRAVRGQWWRDRLVGMHTMWGETYSPGALREARRRYKMAMQVVASRGVLAMYFARRPDAWGEAFFTPVCAWFDENRIRLDVENYIPFYSVYALLNGPFRRDLLGGRRILVVTHLTDRRKSAIEKGLLADGAASVQFAPVSYSGALLDTVDLARLEHPVDLALVAAGIGSVNVLCQLEPLAVPCLDCGIALECYVAPERRWERPFLIDDSRMTATDLDSKRLF